MRFEQLPTPCYVIDIAALKRNLQILEQVRLRTGAKILLAQKAFSAFCVYPLIGQYLDGTVASGLYEAKLGAEMMKKENHVFAPAYKESDFDPLLEVCDHIVFNSLSQLALYGQRARAAGKEVGLRVNPQCSTQQGHAIYDPCGDYSRLGVIPDLLQELSDCVTGLHFHTLCEQDADALQVTLQAVEEKFGKYFSRIKWLNFGGGHHITRPGYHIDLLEQCIRHIQQQYGLQIYLEPGEAVALNAGYLVSTVMDIVQNGRQIAILDASAACHMPDVLEMPYRPPLRGSGDIGEKSYSYRLAGNTCLAGDVIGDYSFDAPLHVGDRLIFEDMAIYSMVKNNTFNGIPLPAIAVMEESGDCQLIRQFSYQDFKNRLS